jgi:hypothetical protein
MKMMTLYAQHQLESVYEVVIVCVTKERRLQVNCAADAQGAHVRRGQQRGEGPGGFRPQQTGWEVSFL